jgi:DNA-directed RNA polymerase specialized sigma24 family protein
MTGAEGGQTQYFELAALVRRTKAGDITAFGQILMRHERRVFMTPLRLLGSLEDAKDAAQLAASRTGLATSEVARILGCSEATVRSMASSARLKIKRFAGRVLGRV